MIGRREAFKQIMREWPAWGHFFYFDSYGLRFEASDNDWKPSAAANFTQNQGICARLGLTVRQTNNIQLNFFHIITHHNNLYADALYSFTAAINLGTTSNASPTMP